ncbi:MAG: hypothetical protein PVI82_05325 [Desulfobacterales bacterium]|jgi:short-subunit dehydrogenase
MACQEIGKHWIERKEKGGIINMSSMAAMRPLSRAFIYSLAKASQFITGSNLVVDGGFFVMAI